ncbi:acyltransferase family protein [Polynucleobacter asymbioticus]|nr:acyltransferase family protein [Polynucleobacter asymbioticus]
MSFNPLFVDQAPLHLKYRKDIDGLRALAVLLVVIYHAFPNWAHGGFVGVDIFFVISGYLITSIILDGLADKTFSLVDFYCKRIIRIFPALILVLACSIGLGWFMLYPAELQLLGKHLLSAVGFFSNFTYLSEAGYFDSQAVEKPLLHLWSLAIEEQFYLIWPILLCFLYKLRSRSPSSLGFSLRWYVLLLIACSFAWNVHLIHINKSAAFYLPFSRFWELLVGALLANVFSSDQSGSRGGDGISSWGLRLQTIAESALFRQLVSFLGLTCLVVGVIVIYPRSLFPGWLALLPVVGAALIIYGGEKTWINRYLLSNRFMVAIGLISYPLYLWHWALLSFAQIWGPIFIEQRLLIVGLSLMFSWLTYRLIEKPLRNRQFIRKKSSVLIGLMIAILAVGFILTSNGFSERGVNTLSQFEQSAQDGSDGGFVIQGCGLSDLAFKEYFAGCFEDRREPAKFALVGDSKAMALFPGLVRSSQAGGRWLTIYGPGGDKAIMPYLSDSRADVKPSQSLYADQAVKQISLNSQVKVVALAFSSKGVMTTDVDSLYKGEHQAQAIQGLDAIVAKLVESRKQVVLIVDNPTLALPQDCFHRKLGISWLDQFEKIDPRCSMTYEKHTQMTAKYLEVLNAVAKKYPGQVRVFDSGPVLCDVQNNICSYQKNGRKMYSYTDHISDYAAGRVGEALNHQLVDSSR